MLIPLADPESAEQLIRAGSAVARYRDGEILLTSVATVPEQTPLSEGRQYADKQRALLDDAMQYVPDDVPAHRMITIGHDVPKSINNVAYQRDSDLVLAWFGFLTGGFVCVGTGSLIGLAFLSDGEGPIHNTVSILASFIGFGFGAGLLRMTAATVIASIL